jgi:3-phosphoshikimate 1-carboxyvinyltransferase
VRITPAHRFRGRFTLPGDKSLSHRLAILGAIAQGETWIHNFSTSADCASTLGCLAGLGVEIRRLGKTVAIQGRGPEALRAPAGALDAGNSGSTVRMLAGVLASRPFRTVLTGDDSLLTRPMERVAIPLRAMGAVVVSRDGKPPLTIEGAPLRAIEWDLPVASAQVKTAVLLAGLEARGRTTVREIAPSRDHTERLLPAFGCPIEREGPSVSIQGGAPLHGLEWTVPGDISSAAFLVVAALILPGSEVRLDHVLLNPQRTAFLDVLKAMGGRIASGIEQADPEPVGWIVAASSDLTGIELPQGLVPSLIDEIPALAVAATHAAGTFTVAGAQELRVKESDRISSLVEGLGRLGAKLTERPDGFLVHGGRPLRGAPVQAWGDHRIAMALAVAALSAQGETEIGDAECASVSFPEFYSLLEEAVEGGDGAAP